MDQIMNKGNLSNLKFLFDGDLNEFFDQFLFYVLSKILEFYVIMFVMLFDIFKEL